MLLSTMHRGNYIFAKFSILSRVQLGLATEWQIVSCLQSPLSLNPFLCKSENVNPFDISVVWTKLEMSNNQNIAFHTSLSTFPKVWIISEILNITSSGKYIFWKIAIPIFLHAWENSYDTWQLSGHGCFFLLLRRHPSVCYNSFAKEEIQA